MVHNWQEIETDDAGAKNDQHRLFYGGVTLKRELLMKGNPSVLTPDEMREILRRAL